MLLHPPHLSHPHPPLQVQLPALTLAMPSVSIYYLKTLSYSALLDWKLQWILTATWINFAPSGPLQSGSLYSHAASMPLPVPLPLSLHALSQPSCRPTSSGKPSRTNHPAYTLSLFWHLTETVLCALPSLLPLDNTSAVIVVIMAWFNSKSHQRLSVKH